MKSITQKKDECFFFADNYGWEEFDFQDNIGMVSYVKGDFRINIYLTKMTLGIIKDRKTYYHKKVTPIKLEKIFINPGSFLTK